MVQIKEFRIVMPLSVEEYEVAQVYMIMKLMQQSTTSTEGIETLEDKPFEDDVYGKGQYTSKIYRLQSKVPAWLTAFAKRDALIVQEEAWNAYPICKSVIKCPCFSKSIMTIETIHKADNGCSENVHGLNNKQLAARQVEFIDIASTERDCWSYLIGTNDVDLSKFKSMKTSRGLLTKGWQKRCNPVMTAYKLVIIDAPYWGFGNKLEQTLLAGERALFLESHRNCFAWIDNWYGLTLEIVHKIEQEAHSSLTEKLDKLALENKEDKEAKRCNRRLQIKPSKHEYVVLQPS